MKQNNSVLAPSFTAYVPESLKPSLLVGFTDGNDERRSKARKEHRNFRQKVILYTSKRIIPNQHEAIIIVYLALSLQAAQLLITQLRIVHLLPPTRTVSSLGNSSNEKVITGNRHYRNADIILNNLISITSSVVLEELEPIMEKYQLHYPTAEEVLDVIHYSSDLYFKDYKAFKKIEDFVAKLNKYERAGFVYFGDLYHIRVYNEEFIRTFITRISSKYSGEFVDPIGYLKENVEKKSTNS